MNKNAWQMLKSSLYMQRSLVLDNGHALVPVPKRCCWNLPKAHVQFSVLRLHCPEVNSGDGEAKDMENCRFTIVPTRQRLRLFFEKIVSANQLSLYGAVANMCEEYESLHDRSGRPDMVMGQSIVLSAIKTEVPSVR